MRVSVKVLGIAMGIIMVTAVIILSLWKIPAPQTEIHKVIPNEKFLNKK